jgi:hypothetical protein
MRSRSVLSETTSAMNGVNVPIQPQANANNQMTNNITIKTVSYPNPGIEQNNSICEDKTGNPYKNVDIQARYVETRDMSSIDEYLLSVYQTILLNEDKKLLSNMISKDSIILTKEDLQEVIKRKTGLKCYINYEDIDMGCFGKNPVLLKIDSIRVYEENDSVGSDFKIKFNNDYLELIAKYHLNMKYILIN